MTSWSTSYTCTQRYVSRYYHPLLTLNVESNVSNYNFETLKNIFVLKLPDSSELAVEANERPLSSKLWISIYKYPCARRRTKQQIILG